MELEVVVYVVVLMACFGWRRDIGPTRHRHRELSPTHIYSLQNAFDFFKLNIPQLVSHIQTTNPYYFETRARFRKQTVISQHDLGGVDPGFIDVCGNYTVPAEVRLRKSRRVCVL